MVEGRIQRPVVDDEKCNACLACVKGCPAEIIPEMRTEESSLRGRIYKDISTAPTFNIDIVMIDLRQNVVTHHAADIQTAIMGRQNTVV